MISNLARFPVGTLQAVSSASVGLIHRGAPKLQRTQVWQLANKAVSVSNRRLRITGLVGLYTMNERVATMLKLIAKQVFSLIHAPTFARKHPFGPNDLKGRAWPYFFQIKPSVVQCGGYGRRAHVASNDLIRISRLKMIAPYASCGQVIIAKYLPRSFPSNTHKFTQSISAHFIPTI